MANSVLILCLVMTLILLSMPIIILIIAAVKEQKPILKVALLWLVVNVGLVILVWVLYFAKLQYLVK